MCWWSAIAWAAAGPWAILPEPILGHGDDVGHGDVRQLHGVAVNDLGDWVLNVGTTHNTAGLVGPDGVLLWTGDPIPGTDTGTVQDVWGSQDAAGRLTDRGAGVWTLRVDDTILPGADVALVLGEHPIAWQGQHADVDGLPVGTTIEDIGAAKANDAGVVVAHVSCDPPDSPFIEPAMVRYQLGRDGEVRSARTLVRWGDLLPGHTAPVDGFGPSGRAFALDGHGRTLLQVSAADFDALVLDQATLLAEGDVLEERWTVVDLLGGAALSDTGRWSALVEVEDPHHPPTREALIVDGQIVVLVGEPRPGGTHDVTDIHSQVALANDGSIVYLLRSPDPAAPEGLYLNDELVVATGATVIDGVGVVQGIGDWDLSDNGRWLGLIVHRDLDGDAHFEDFAVVVELPGLTLTAPDTPRPGVANAFTVHGANPGHRIGLAAALEPGGTSFPCDGRRSVADLGGPTLGFGVDVADAQGTVTLMAEVRADASGRTVFFQAVDTDNCQASNVAPVAFSRRSTR